MAKAFASQSDMSEKKISFTEIGEGLYAFTAEGDPNSGIKGLRYYTVYYFQIQSFLFLSLDVIS